MSLPLEVKSASARELNCCFYQPLMHTISTRPVTPEERQQIKWNCRPDYASYGCITIFFLAGGFGFGLFAGWIGGMMSPEVKAYGTWIGWVVAAILGATTLVAFAPYDRRGRQRAALDLQAGVVQVICVADPRVIEIGLINDNEPILAFDIGNGKILFLQGQWLRHSDTYDVESLDADDSYEEFFNDLPPPHSFPSTKFTILRFPHSGNVIGIQVEGSYLEPDTVVEALKPEFEFGDSEIFDGELADIADVLGREHARRRRQ